MLGRLSGRVRVLIGLGIRLTVSCLRAPTHFTMFRLMGVRLKCVAVIIS